MRCVSRDVVKARALCTMDSFRATPPASARFRLALLPATFRSDFLSASLVFALQRQATPLPHRYLAFSEWTSDTDRELDQVEALAQHPSISTQSVAQPINR